ncbi:MAG: serine hydrolase domain-containing protein [Gemmataceae bacterium]
MTIPIVTFAALLLYERGQLDLDEPIAKRLPEWRNVKVLEKMVDKKTGKNTFRLVPAKNPITVRDLMRHSSGLYYAFVPKTPTFRLLKKAGVFEKGINLAEFSKRLAKAPLKFHPGTAYNYGYSIDILGRYVEVVSKQPLDVFLKKNVFEPLKMKDTDFWTRDKERIAVVYTKKEGKLTPAMSNAPLLKKPSWFSGGGGLVSTSTDYWRFCQMVLDRGQLDGVRIAKAKTVELMYQNQLGSVYPGGKRTYGLGGAIDGKGVYRWGGAAGTKFFVDTKNKLVVVYMVQRRGYTSFLWPQVQRLVLQAVEPEGQESK